MTRQNEKKPVAGAERIEYCIIPLLRRANVRIGVPRLQCPAQGGKNLTLYKVTIIGRMTDENLGQDGGP